MTVNHALPVQKPGAVAVAPMLADDIREGDNLRSLSNNVLLSHVASSTIALRVVEIDLIEPYARMVASDLGECVEVFVSSGPFIDFLLDSY